MKRALILLLPLILLCACTTKEDEIPTYEPELTGEEIHVVEQPVVEPPPLEDVEFMYKFDNLVTKISDYEKYLETIYRSTTPMTQCYEAVEFEDVDAYLELIDAMFSYNPDLKYEHEDGDSYVIRSYSTPDNEVILSLNIYDTGYQYVDLTTTITEDTTLRRTSGLIEHYLGLDVSTSKLNAIVAKLEDKVNYSVMVADKTNPDWVMATMENGQLSIHALRTISQSIYDPTYSYEFEKNDDFTYTVRLPRTELDHFRALGQFDSIEDLQKAVPTYAEELEDSINKRLGSSDIRVYDDKVSIWFGEANEIFDFIVIIQPNGLQRAQLNINLDELHGDYVAAASMIKRCMQLNVTASNLQQVVEWAYANLKDEYYVVRLTGDTYGDQLMVGMSPTEAHLGVTRYISQKGELS